MDGPSSFPLIPTLYLWERGGFHSKLLGLVAVDRKTILANAGKCIPKANAPASET